MNSLDDVIEGRLTIPNDRQRLVEAIDAAPGNDWIVVVSCVLPGMCFICVPGIRLLVLDVHGRMLFQQAENDNGTR